jgi:hypothetical protein
MTSHRTSRGVSNEQGIKRQTIANRRLQHQLHAA